MGLTLEAVKELVPKIHPPAWALRLCEDILDECWKTEAQTGAGGARALRNARRAAAGENVQCNVYGARKARIKERH